MNTQRESCPEDSIHVHSLVRSLEAYREVLQANGSIAKHLGISLFINKLESRVCELFSTPFPCMEGVNDLEERQISWLDIVKEKIPTERFTHTATPGIYSCRIGTVVLRMPEADRDLVCSDTISKVLYSRPEP